VRVRMCACVLSNACVCVCVRVPCFGRVRVHVRADTEGLYTGAHHKLDMCALKRKGRGGNPRRGLRPSLERD
jgi:hypothetical protein